MADGSVKIKIDVDGKQLDSASDSFQDFKKGTKDAGDGAKKASVGVKELVTSLGLVKIASAAFNVMAQSMDRAISRFDKLNSFPKVMEGLGVESEIAQQAIDKIADGLDGTSGYLDDVSSNAQRMYTSFKDLDKSADVALALQRAFDASGASADEASRGTEQYIQALQKGKFEMDEWKTLQQTMNVGLHKIAESFGVTESELYQALKNGTISMDDFNNKLLEVGSATGELADLAKTNSGGIANSISYLRSSVSTGLANILTSVNNLVKEVTGNEIEHHLNALRAVVKASMKAIGFAIEGTAPFIIAFASGIQSVIPIVQTLTPLIAGLAAAYATLVIIQKVKSWYTGVSTAMEGVSVVTALLTGQMAGQTIAQLASTEATKADTIAMLLNTKALTVGQITVGLLTGNLTLATAATLAKAKAVTVLSGVLKVLAGPVGWIVAGIGLLVAGTVALVKWLNRSTEEGEKLTNQTEELSDSTNSLVGEINESANAYDRNIRGIEATSEANLDLIDRIQALHEEEIKSSEMKKELKEDIELLNREVTDMNLAYDEEADALNMSSEEMARRVELMAEQDKAAEGQQRLLEISKEQSKVDQELEYTNKLREEWNRKLEDGEVTSREYKKAVEELQEAETNLSAQQVVLGEQYEETSVQRTEALENVTRATEENVGQQILLYEELSESNKTIVDGLISDWQDYKDKATDAFDVLSEKQELSIGEMQANMEENQRVMENWADNIAILAERGISEGLLEELRNAGPESAGHVKALVEASDEQLFGYDETFSQAGQTATQAMATSLGEGSEEIIGAVDHLIQSSEGSMRDAIASADFPGVGEDVADGLAQGVEQGAQGAIDASGQMADDMTEKTKNTLQTHSPSKVYMNIGEDVADGLALGIKNGTTNVMTAIDSMFKRLLQASNVSFKKLTLDFDKSVKELETSLNRLGPITTRAMSLMMTSLRTGSSSNVALMTNLSSNLTTPFDSLGVRMSNIGAHAMNGMISGMNSRSGAVIATARSIANSVSATMQSALRIQSPSKVMELDVGRWIPEGLAVGIKKNINTVDQAIGKMTDSFFTIRTPELALGGASLGGVNYARQRASKATSSDKTTNTSNSYVVNIDTIENYTDQDIPRILEESVWVMGRKDRGRLYE